jgi:hypothetical protein
MTSVKAMQSSVQNQQHPFLFQPQHNLYSSGDDVDSPPSLTTSSESPRSASEEGEPSSSHFDTFDRANTTRASGNKKGEPTSDQLQQKDINKVKRESGNFNGSIVGEVEDSFMSPIDAVSPSWESVFSASANGNEMDMSTSLGETDTKEWRSVSDGTLNTNALASNHVAASNEAIKMGTGVDMWPSEAFANNFQSWTSSGNADSRANDEVMFDSLIQEDSFE